LKNEPASDPPQTIVSLPVQTAMCPDRALGAPRVVMPVQLRVLASCMSPVCRACRWFWPPRMIILWPVQTAVWSNRAVGAPTCVSGNHRFSAGLYLPPSASGTRVSWS